MNNGYIADIITQLTSNAGNTEPTCPLGTVVMADSMHLGLVLADASQRNFAMKFTYVRFGATIAAAGYCCQWLYDATYLSGTVTGTYTAAAVYANAGISISAVATAGLYGWIQSGGLNGWAVTAAAAAVAIGDVLYPTATNELTVAASDANRMKRLAVAQRVDADGGALGVGLVMILPNAAA